MRWFRKGRTKESPMKSTDADARDALKRAQHDDAEATEDLAEMKRRSARIRFLGRETNHFAPLIYDAMRRR